jgi:glycosyltransferase involved in cell wall biosynthesis
MVIKNGNNPINIAVVGIKGIPARYGGFETCVEETCRRLVIRGHKVTVYCRRDLSKAKYPYYEGIKLRYVPSLRSKNMATITSSLFASFLVIASKAQIVHLYTVGTGVFVPLFKFFGKSVVVSADALDWQRKKWSKFAKLYMKLAARIAVHWADEIIIDSKVVQEYYKDYFKRLCAYVPFGADTAPYKGDDAIISLGLRPRRYFLFVGILRAEKQVDLLIQAFNQIDQSFFDLAILGDNPLEPNYVKYIMELAGPRVRFLGRIYGLPYIHICQNAYAYITPSEIEGTSPALLSAMGAGCCVLVNGIPENLETIGNAGFFFSKNDIQDLVKKIIFLMQNPALVLDYGQKARERVTTHYSWDSVTLEFESIYRKAIAKDKTPYPKGVHRT